MRVGVSQVAIWWIILGAACAPVGNSPNEEGHNEPGGSPGIADRLNQDAAPKDLESLMGYIFEHMDDDDTAELIDGLEQLHMYMQDRKICNRRAWAFKLKT